jgi:hypothetical protein
VVHPVIAYKRAIETSLLQLIAASPVRCVGT